MYGTIERVEKVKQRALQLQNKKEHRQIGILSSICVMLSTFLIGAIGAVAERGHTSVGGFYGAMLMYENAGSHVLVGVVSFITAVVITVFFIRNREKQDAKKLKDE